MTIINQIGKYKAAGRSWYQRNQNGITRFTVHHTASRSTGTHDQILRAEANHHINGNGWVGLAYHFVILKDGSIHQINNFTDVTWHDGNNWDSIGICLQGYFHSPYNEKPTTEQVRSLKELLDWLSTKHPQFPAAQKNTWGHRDRMSTACPGDAVYPLVKEYREKAGNVSWGSAPAPTPLTPEQKLQQITTLVQGTGTIDKWRIREVLQK